MVLGEFAVLGDAGFAGAGECGYGTSDVVDLADALVADIRYVDLQLIRGHRDADGLIEFGLSDVAAVPGEAFLASSGHRAYFLRFWIVVPQAVVKRIRDEQDLFTRHPNQVVHPIEFGLRSRAVVARIPLLAGPRERRQNPFRVNLAEAFAAGHLDEVDVTRLIEVDRERLHELCFRRFHTVGPVATAGDEDDFVRGHRYGGEQYKTERKE